MKTIKNKLKFKKMKKKMELLEKNINEFAQRLNNFEAILKANKNTELEKIINKTCKGSIMNDFTTKQAKEAIMQAVLETLKNTKTEQVEKLKEFFNFKYEINETEQTEQNIEYYLNFTSKDASNVGQDAYNKQLIEIIEKIKEVAKEGKDNYTFYNIANEVISLLKSNGFHIFTETQEDYNKKVKISW